MKPYDKLPTSVEYNGRTYAVDMSYTAFLLATDILTDERLTNTARIVCSLNIFIDEPHPADARLLNEIISIIKNDRPKSDKKLMDIEQDWEYICGAFQQAYGINLWQERKMHILRFLALLRSIPKTTKLAEIINIRGQDIPQPNKYNHKEISELTRLKAFYALKSNKKTLDEAWGKLFEVLEMKAKEHG